MNLKESFRYQKFLETMMRSAQFSIMDRNHAFKTTRQHLKHKANTDADDFTEVVETEPFTPNDEVIRFMQWIIAERQSLTEAITKAKNSVGFDIDAAVETNKFRQLANGSIQNMLKFKGTKRIEPGKDYKFNVEGNQTQYLYDIETVTTEAFDRERSKEIMRSLIMDADKVSAELDSAMINTQVDYEPKFDVNDTFEDVMLEFANIE